ncbi:MAG: hypothetical protein M1827_007718 [Pycnora praestabilis]|nr:MAG: hypothetical protein M1827_007718 [Pycnora praestabilis]
MPPMIEEEESGQSGSENEEIPYKPKNQNKEDENVKLQENEEMGDEDAEEEDDDPDKYVVEKIFSHTFDVDGNTLYEVKWEGYDTKTDRTFEPEENLDGAKDILNEYFESIGGRPVLNKKTKPAKATVAVTPESGRKRKNQANGKKTKDEAKGSKKKRRLPASPSPPASSKRWEPPSGSWEDSIQGIDTLEATENELWVYLVWNDGHRSRHLTQKVYQKCPQRMLEFYEQHLVFKEGKGKKLDE